MKYKDYTNPIIPKPCTAWISITTSGKKQLTLFHTKATVEEIIRYLKNYIKEDFKICTVDVGDFVLSEVTSTYSHDGRKIDNHFNVSLS